MKYIRFNYIIFLFLLITSTSICNEPFSKIGNVPINYYRIFLIFLYIFIIFYCLIKRKDISFLLVYTIFIFGFSIIKLAINNSLVVNFLNCYTGGALVFFVFYSVNSNIDTLKGYMHIFIFFSIINVILGIIEYYTRTNILGNYIFRKDGFSLPPIFTGVRVDGVFKTPEMFIINCDLALITVLEMNKFMKSKVYILYSLLFLYSNFICYFTFNLLFLFMMYIIRDLKRLNLKTVSILIIIAVGFLFYKNNQYFLTKSIGSFYSRIGGYIYNINKIKDSPLLGQSKLDLYYDRIILSNGILGNMGCHNILLEILVDGGIVLLIIVILFYIYIYRKLKGISSLYKVFFTCYLIVWGSIFAIIVLYNVNVILYAFLGCIIQLKNNKSYLICKSLN